MGPRTRGQAARRPRARIKETGLITSSNFVGCCTGRSTGFAPFRILSTFSLRAKPVGKDEEAWLALAAHCRERRLQFAQVTDLDELELDADHGARMCLR